MIYFPDKRSRYNGVFQADVSAGNPNGQNPVKTPEGKSDIAIRVPRGAFRVTTTEDPMLLQSQAEAEALQKRQEAEASSESASLTADQPQPSSSQSPDSDFDLDL